MGGSKPAVNGLFNLSISKIAMTWWVVETARRHRRGGDIDGLSRGATPGVQNMRFIRALRLGRARSSLLRSTTSPPSGNAWASALMAASSNDSGRAALRIRPSHGSPAESRPASFGMSPRRIGADDSPRRRQALWI